jgi:hypothetical protein
MMAQPIKPGSLTSEKIVLQRNGGDCSLASLATVMGWTYEMAAEVLGLAIDPDTGFTELQDHEPIYENEIIPPLFRMGVLAIPLASNDAIVNLSSSFRRATLPSTREVRDMISGRVGIVGVIVDEPVETDLEKFHSLAWDGSQLFDCRDGAAVDLDEANICSALLLSRTRET